MVIPVCPLETRRLHNLVTLCHKLHLVALQRTMEEQLKPGFSCHRALTVRLTMEIPEVIVTLSTMMCSKCLAAVLRGRGILLDFTQFKHASRA